MIDLLCCFRRRVHPVRLNQEFHLDLRWWHQFLAEWHGVSFWLFPGLLPEADVEVSSDAAGSLGYGAYLKGQWFAGSWAPSQQLQSIAYKELFLIILAAHVWGHSWVKKHTLHIEQGFPDPIANCLRLQIVVRGIKRCQGSSSSSHLPITDDLMLLIWQSLDLCLPDHLMFWAACSLGYFGFLRASEFTVPNLASFSPSLNLGVQDIAVDSLSAPSCMRVKIKGSKTDPFRKGAYIHIGRGRPPLCAVHSVISYLASRGDRSGPLFLFQNGQPLSHALLMDWLLASANIPGNFSSHSFRIGAATVAARNGVPDHLIQALGRWSSSAYQLYIRTPSESLAALSTKLAPCPTTSLGYQCAFVAAQQICSSAGYLSQPGPVPG